MEEATTSSWTHCDEEERSAGGKFRKPTARKPHTSTPYDRPPSSSAAAAAKQSLAVRRQDGGWLSKLVDPACRLISSGATRMFPSFFAIHPPSDNSATSDHDSKQDASIDDPRFTENLGMSTAAGLAGPVKEADRSKRASNLDDHEEDKGGILCNDDRLCEIEQMLKGKILSREELNRLTEILRSKAANLSNDSTQKKIANTGARAQTEGLVIAQEMQRKSVEEKQEDLNGAIWRTPTPVPPSLEVGASPVEIARAYMENRTPDVRMGSNSKILTVVQDHQGGCLTPQSQRGRFGLQNFPQTPYSRTIYSKSKTKLLQSQLDSCGYSGSPTPLQQSWTPTYGLTKSRGDALNGSIGPIRRMRHNSVSETPRGSVSLLSSQNGPSQVGNSKISGGLLPFGKSNLEIGATSSPLKFQSVDSIPRSSEVGISLARRISEHVDRNKPTPKEKLAELNLAAGLKKSTSSEMTSFMSKDRIDLPEAQMNIDTGNSLSKRQHQERTSEFSGADLVLNESDVASGSAGHSLYLKKTRGSQSNSTSEMTIAGLDSSRQKDKCHLWPLHSQSNVQVASKMVPNGDMHGILNQPKKLPPHSSRAKRGLGYISIDKPDLRSTASFDNNSGFTFPIAASSNVTSEPPTPSVMPSFTTAALHQPEEEYAVPSYKFGTKKSTPPLVFSFPSTSSATTNGDDASDIMFNFGSEKTTRVSFSPVGKNGIYS